MKILITGGAGFIGSYLSNLLYNEGHEVFVVDNLHPQVHGEKKYDSILYKTIIGKTIFVESDILNVKNYRKYLEEADVVVHLAAETGTGQSMYEISNTVNTNSLGTSVLLEEIVKNKKINLKKFILASSRAVYGEGKYYCQVHGVVYPKDRNIGDLKQRDFECKCPYCSKSVTPLATDEESQTNPKSIYGVSKFNQEQLTRVACESKNINYTIFRFQNVYGKLQSLNNPYTGILVIFTNLLLNDRKINIFEDGLESRDFVHVKDVVKAVLLDINSEKMNKIYNVGSGKRVTVREIVNILEKEIGVKNRYEISGDFRVGDIRHNFADLENIRHELNFSPDVTLEEGIGELVSWLKNVNIDLAIEERYINSLKEMQKVSLLIKG